MTGHTYRLPNGAVPVLVSADSPDLMRADAAALLSYTENHPEISPSRIADMLFRTRVARRCRTLALAVDREQLIGVLRAVIDGRDHPQSVRSATPAASHRLAYVFPGQGGQRPGMGKMFYDSIPVFRAESDRCADAFEAQLGYSPMEYLLDEHLRAEDTARTVQPALFVQMAGLAAMWRSFGVAPAVTVGHSQGEIAAAYVSGAMTLTDAVLVVGTRARAADEFVSGDYAMAVAAADRDTCEEILARCSGWAELSVVNSPNMVGISGGRDTVHGIVETFTQRGVFARVIGVQYPAHTSAINGLGDRMRSTLRDGVQNAEFLHTEIACIGATLGGAITQDLPVDQYWFWNLRNTVRFDKAIRAAVELGVDTFVELSEHPALQLAIEENVSADVVGTSQRTAPDLDEVTRNLARIAVGDLDYPWACLRVEGDGPPVLPLIDFPNTPMNAASLWQIYDAPSPIGAAPAENTTPGIPARSAAPARLLLEEWVRLSRRSLVPPRAIGIIDHTGACADLAEAICTAAADVGATARVIGNVGDEGDLDTRLVLLPPSPTVDDAAAAALVATFFAERTWWPELAGTTGHCWLVTVGGEAVVEGDAPPSPVHAAAGAGFRSIGAEYPGVAFGHLDLPVALPASDAAAAILSALHTADEPELAHRNGLYAKRIAEAETSPAASDSAPPAHVLITGGTGNLGLEFCEHFANTGAARITLVSRSGETDAVAGRLRQIRAGTSAQIDVLRCDIGDAEAVSRLAAEFEDAPADMIVHTAVAYTDLELSDITREAADAALRAKVVGIGQILDSVRRTDTCRVQLCSSMAATIGGRGQAVYAAANRMLDAMAHRLRAYGLDCVSVQWGQWTVHLDLDAAGRAKLEGTGVVAMSPTDALARGMSGLRQNAIVAAFDLGRARPALETFGYGPLLSLLTSEPVAASERVDTTDVSQRFMKLLAEVIGLDNAESIDTTIPMVAIGLDSLQALEFRKRVQVEFDYELEVADLLSGASIDDALAKLSALPRTATPVARVNPADVVQQARLTAEQVVPRDLDVARMSDARADLDVVGMGAMMNALSPALSRTDARSADDILDRLDFAPRHRWLLDRWLSVLTKHGHLDHEAGRGYRVGAPVPEPMCQDLFAMCADLGYPRALADFMRSCNEHLTELAQDRVRIQELLFADGEMATAVAGYRDNVVGHYLNRAAREVIAGLAGNLAGDRSPVRILELGAGTGGTTDDVLAGLVGLPVDYQFTDVSQFFLRAAEERFGDHPQLRYGIVDLNADLPPQEHCDIVLAANVIHNALHIGDTLGRLHELINPGGALVFIETCTANYQLLTSLKFLMSPNPGQPHPGKSDIRAGRRIFLSEVEWCDQLAAAGFTPLPVLPAADHALGGLDQRLFAAARS